MKHCNCLRSCSLQASPQDQNKIPRLERHHLATLQRTPTRPMEEAEDPQFQCLDEGLDLYTASLLMCPSTDQYGNVIRSFPR